MRDLATTIQQELGVTSTWEQVETMGMYYLGEAKGDAWAAEFEEKLRDSTYLRRLAYAQTMNPTKRKESSDYEGTDKITPYFTSSGESDSEDIGCIYGQAMANDMNGVDPRDGFKDFRTGLPIPKGTRLDRCDKRLRTVHPSVKAREELYVRWCKFIQEIDDLDKLNRATLRLNQRQEAGWTKCQEAGNNFHTYLRYDQFKELYRYMYEQSLKIQREMTPDKVLSKVERRGNTYSF